MLVCMLELHACAILTSCTVTVLVVDQVLCFMLATSVSLVQPLIKLMSELQTVATCCLRSSSLSSFYCPGNDAF